MAAIRADGTTVGAGVVPASTKTAGSAIVRAAAIRAAGVAISVAILSIAAGVGCGNSDEDTVDDQQPEVVQPKTSDEAVDDAIDEDDLVDDAVDAIVEAEAVPESFQTVVSVQPGEAIQIRSLNVLSGDSAFLGIGNHRGVELALQDHGKIMGFPVDLGVGVDGLCAAEGGQAAAQTIVADERVVGVIGPSCSITATAAAPLVTAAGMVMIAPSNTSPSLTSDLAGTPGANHSEGYFRTSHNDLFQGRAVAEFLYTRRGFRKAAAIHDGDPYTQGLASAFTDAFEALGGTTDTGHINKEDSNMEPVLIQLASSAPDALFLPVFRPAGDFIADQASSVAGLEQTKLIGAPSLGDDFMRLPQSEGMYFTGPDTRLGANVNQATGTSASDVLAAYISRYGEEPSSPYWAQAYDATTMLLDAIAAAATLEEDGTLLIDRGEVLRSLHAISGYGGLTGTLGCDTFGDCGTQRLIITEHLDPADPAASKQNIVYEFAP